MDRVTRILRRRILRERLAVAEAKRDAIISKLRVLKSRESKRVTRGILDDMSAHARSTRTAL